MELQCIVHTPNQSCLFLHFVVLPTFALPEEIFDKKIFVTVTQNIAVYWVGKSTADEILLNFASKRYMFYVLQSSNQLQNPYFFGGEPFALMKVFIRFEGMWYCYWKKIGPKVISKIAVPENFTKLLEFHFSPDEPKSCLFWIPVGIQIKFKVSRRYLFGLL